MTLNTSQRHVIATAGPDKYLVSLSVTTSIDQVVAAARRHRCDRQRVPGERPRGAHSTPTPAPTQAPGQGPTQALGLPHLPCRRPPPATDAGVAAERGAAAASGPTGISVVPRAKPGARRTPIRRAMRGSYCVPHADRRGALLVRRRRSRRYRTLALTRPVAADPVRQVLRAVAPTQLAAAVMLAAGGVVALSARPQTGLVVVVVCVVGAVGTVAAGCWQSAKAVARRQTAARLRRSVRDVHIVL